MRQYVPGYLLTYYSGRGVTLTVGPCLCPPSPSQTRYQNRVEATYLGRYTLDPLRKERYLYACVQRTRVGLDPGSAAVQQPL